MSKCISRNGEFSDHELGEGAHEFTCSRCWAFDEDAAIATVAELRQKLSDCELLLTDLGKTHTRVSGERDELRATVAKVRSIHERREQADSDIADEWCVEEDADWPCATIRALGGAGESE